MERISKQDMRALDRQWREEQAEFDYKAIKEARDKDATRETKR